MSSSVMAGGGSDLFIDQVGRPDQASRPPEKRNTGASFVKLTLLLRRAALRQWSSSYQQHAQTAMISFKLFARGDSETTLSKNKVVQVKNESQVFDQTLA